MQYEETLSAATVSALSANNHRDFTEHMAQVSGGHGPVLIYSICSYVMSTADTRAIISRPFVFHSPLRIFSLPSSY